MEVTVRRLLFFGLLVLAASCGSDETGYTGQDESPTEVRILTFDEVDDGDRQTYSPIEDGERIEAESLDATIELRASGSDDDGLKRLTVELSDRVTLCGSSISDGVGEAGFTYAWDNPVAEPSLGDKVETGHVENFTALANDLDDRACEANELDVCGWVMEYTVTAYPYVGDSVSQSVSYEANFC